MLFVAVVTIDTSGFPLFGNFLTTFPNLLTTFWQRFDNFSQLFDSFSQLFDNFLTAFSTFWQLFDNFLTIYFFNFLTQCDTITHLWHHKSSLDPQITAEGTVGAPTCFGQMWLNFFLCLFSTNEELFFTFLDCWVFLSYTSRLFFEIGNFIPIYL
jgi:hypothetical protein